MRLCERKTLCVCVWADVSKTVFLHQPTFLNEYHIPGEEEDALSSQAFKCEITSGKILQLASSLISDQQL